MDSNAATSYFLRIFWEGLSKKFGNTNSTEVQIPIKAWRSFFGLRFGLSKQQSRAIGEMLISTGYPLHRKNSHYVLMQPKAVTKGD